MIPPLRIGLFVAVLALVFGAAAFVGSRVDVGAAPAAAEEDGSGHGGMAMDADPVRGLAVSEGGLTLELGRRSAPVGERVELRFRVTRADGSTVRAFDVEHTKRMHLIVVRRDLTGFQHLHPVQRADGTWSVPVTLGAAGTYRVFADFSVDGTAHTLADDLVVDGAVTSRPLPAPSDRAEVDGLTVERDGLAFAVTRDGRPVALEDYLGAKGHLVALRRGDLAFLHVHPHEDRLAFEAEFPRPGAYRLFLQFQTADGRVHTAAFTR